MKMFSIQHSMTAYKADFLFIGAGMIALLGTLFLKATWNNLLQVILAILSGAILWSFIEYAVHRFILHGVPPFKAWHTLHHEQPKQLVYTPTLLVAVLFICLIYMPLALLLEEEVALGVMFGCLSGYMFYMVVHHVVHHSKTKNKVVLKLKHMHKVHHSIKLPLSTYGVTSGLWDWLFGSDSGSQLVGEKLNKNTEPQSQIAYWTPLLKRLFQSYPGHFSIRFWDGGTLQLGDNGQQSVNLRPFTLVVNRPNTLKILAFGRDPLRLVQAYFMNDIDIEGDFYEALKLKDYLASFKISYPEKYTALLTYARYYFISDIAHDVNTAQYTAPKIYTEKASHTRVESIESVKFHYNLSNEYYALWLDKSMVYSCAYFTDDKQTLEAAQFAKLDYICRKLMLKKGDLILDIGCGWGALIMHAVKYYSVRAHGISLSADQIGLARYKLHEAGLSASATVSLQDYRDCEGTEVYDKIVSVGMFEHVGLDNLPLYFSTVHRLLKPGGLFLNHGITHDVEGWNKTISTEFINRYVFPNGQLDTVSNIQRRMEQSSFEVVDVEALRTHYAKTLRHWVKRLEEKHTEALDYVSEATWRVWRTYMAASALDFASGETGVYQILAVKRNAKTAPLPLTREHLYSDEANSHLVVYQQHQKQQLFKGFSVTAKSHRRVINDFSIDSIQSR